MSDEAQIAESGEEPVSDDQYRQEVMQILRDYQYKQLKFHMVGPVVSLVLHFVCLIAAFLFSMNRRQPPPPTYVVETVQLEAKPLEEEIDMEVKEPEKPEEPELVDMPVDNFSEAVTSPDVPQSDSSSDAEAGTGSNDTLSDMPDGMGSDFTGDTVAMITVMDTSSTPLKLEGLYSARGAGGRAQSVSRYGGSKAGQEAVEKALAWLAKVQDPNGSWAGGQAHTGMALLVFLAHGETPLSEKYGTNVQKGMQWLSNSVMSEAGAGNPYEKGIATYALAEAYGMTKIPFLKAAMEKGLSQIINGQQPGGGFDYSYKKEARWDLSVSGWQFQALKAGVAAGSDNPKLHDAVDKSIKFLKNTAYKNKKFGYASPGSGGNMTGVGTVALQLLGEKTSNEARGGVETISKERLELYKTFLAGKSDFKVNAGGHIYGWYYDTQAMFNEQGKGWSEWQKVFENVLVKNQDREGYWEVDKGPGMGSTNDKERILSTCWTVLQLEVYYRYLPTFDIKKMEKSNSAKGGLDEVDTGLKIE